VCHNVDDFGVVDAHLNPKPPNMQRVSGKPRSEAWERVRCARGLAGLSIHVFAISDSHAEHHQFGISD
jgi:hypothetical protein